jgi:predicted nucleotidyltransferase
MPRSALEAPRWKPGQEANFRFSIMELRSIEAIVTALNSANVEYLIVGGLAVNAHGYERATQDVDLVIGLQPDNTARGLRALMAAGYQPAVPVTPDEFADAALREQWRREKNMIVLKLVSDVHRRTPVDVFVYEPFDFAQEYKLARIEKITGGQTVRIVRLETLLAMKRAAARPRDLADIADLERIQELKKEFDK